MICFKRINSICCIVMSAVIFLTACSSGSTGGSNASNDNIPANVNQKSGWIYVPEIVEIGDKRADYGNMQLIGDTVCYISLKGEAEGETQNICRYSLTDRELKSIRIEWKDDGTVREICCYTFDNDFNVWLVANVYSAGFSQFRRFLYRFDSDGKNIYYQEITEQAGELFSISRVAADGQGRIYIFSPEKEIWLYAQDGSYYGKVSYDSMKDCQIIGAVEGTDGKVYVGIRKGEAATSCTLAEINFEKRQFAEIITDFPAVNDICAQSGEQYDFLMSGDLAAYGYDLSKQKAYELFLWGDSDINGYFVKHLGLLEDGRYFCTVNDKRHGDNGIVLLTKMRAEEAPKRLELVLATVDGGSDLASMAVNFNRNNNQYHVSVKNYDSVTELYNAILAKEAIDIIDLSGVNIENLSRQEIFEDLSAYLEQSDSLDYSDFLEGILDVYTFHGILVGIPESFRLRTVVGNKRLLGNETGLTLDGLFEIAEKNPAAVPFGEVTREEMIQYLVMFNETVFIDWEMGECHFDSEQFKKVLEFAKQFPDHVEEGQEEISMPSKLQNGDILFAIADMRGLRAFQLYEEIFGETAACVGFPTMDGKGGTLLFADNAFGIASGSMNKNGAWFFIESVLRRKNIDGMSNEEIYNAYYYYEPSQFPTMKKAMAAVEAYNREMDNGGHFGTQYYSDGWKFTTHALTEDEINTILYLIPEAQPYFSVKDDEVIRIINEEAQSYFSGQKGVEDVVSLIQNRVKLYVNERM